MVTLAACGGGGASDSTGSSTLMISGAVIDGPIQGARVFLDLNSNLIHDDGEPISGLSDAQGAFTLATEGLTATQLATAMLVSVVPESAKDSDDSGKTLGQAGKQGFTLMAPANAFIQVAANGSNTSQSAVVSPLTTLVAGEILSNGLKLDEARTVVQEEQGLSRDPFTNFIAAGDAGTSSIARAAAVALGQAGGSVAEVARIEGGIAVRDQVQAVIQTVRESLPALVGRLDLKNSAQPAPTVATLVSTLESEQTLTAKAADRVAIQAVGRSTAPSTTQAATAAAPEFHDYIVVFKSTVANPAREATNAAAAHRGTVRFTYTRAIKGFAVRLPATASEAFLNAMSNNPNVDYVETDAQVKTRQLVQSGPTWGLDRVDQRVLPLSKSYSYTAAGNGVRAYVVDTGILDTHTDFSGRVLYTQGFTAISDGNGTRDCNGHGTHVAGTIGSTTYGIAKSVSLVPVRVLDCVGSGSLSGVIAGLDWVINDTNRTTASVINMSLGGGASTSLDSAVAKAVASGITVVVAAGNDNANACNYSPAREPSAITVGATTSTDARSSFSNYGSCLDVFAPGSSITSTWYTSALATSTLNGTSMASPHVAGLAALILGSSPEATPAQVSDMIRTTATASKVTSAGVGSPNLLLYTLAGSSGGVVTPPATASVSVASLSGSGSAVRNGWQATVTLAVKDANGAMVSGATVGGGFTAGGSSVSCTTASNGVCSIKTGTLGKSVSQTNYSVLKITGTGMTYDATKNAINSVIIRKP